MLPVGVVPRRVYTPRGPRQEEQAQLPLRYGSDVPSSTSVPPTAAEAGDPQVVVFVAMKIGPVPGTVKGGAPFHDERPVTAAGGTMFHGQRSSDYRTWNAVPWQARKRPSQVERCSTASAHVAAGGGTLRRGRGGSSWRPLSIIELPLWKVRTVRKSTRPKESGMSTLVAIRREEIWWS